MRKLLTATLAVLFLAPLASATWSIILVNVRTGEVAIGSATCVGGLDLKQWSPVVIVGRGGAAAQSVVDSSTNNRRLIRDEFRKGTPTAVILAMLAARDGGHQGRQYGIVDTRGNATGFTGSQASAWAGHVTGRVGDIVYAIQGNLLAGPAVVNDAETAVRDTAGDLGTRLMAGMEAARAQGGDARCNPRKSAAVGYIILARQGDRDGNCGIQGCSTGDYYLCLNVRNQGSTAADPVFQLQTQYDAWRRSLQGRPDHHLSTVEISPVIPGDRTTAVAGKLVLRDADDRPLTTGGAAITIELDAESTASVAVADITDNGDGTYGFAVTGGETEGTALLRITVNDGSGPVLLSPRTPLLVSADPLWVSTPTISWTHGGRADFVLDAGTTNASRPYLLLASASGDRPGIDLGAGLNLPVNPDGVLVAFYYAAIWQQLPTFFGTLDAQGRASATVTLPPGAFGLPLGTDLTFAHALLNPIDAVSNPVGVHLGR